VDVDRHTVAGLGRGSSGRWIWKRLGGESPYDRVGPPYYPGFNVGYIDKL
jgi:hypothetical protein